jgi:YidC/Oxa1 family membrane protein insertase
MELKRKYFVLLLVIASAMLLLSGCGVPMGGVDVVSQEPSGFWQTLVVWPLAEALIGLNDFLANINMPYSWGFSIILFTIAIKLVTFPLTISQMRGMQAQKELQPQIQELQKKYGKNREKLSQEQMKLYKEAGVNPLSGCLPLLIQMPVLFGLYSALIALGSRLEDAQFFWIPSLGFPRYTDGLSWLSDAFGQGDYGTLAAYLVLPALLMATQVVVQQMTTAATPTPGGDGQAGMMKQMTTVMTLMFGFFTLQVPAGLTLYWVTSNLLQMGQTYAVTGLNVGMPKLPTLPTSTRGTNGAKASSLQLPEAVSSENGDENEEVEETALAASAATSSKRTRRRRQKRRK